MDALSVVEGLDVFKDRGRRVASRGPAVPINQLRLEGAKEALGDCVVPAVSWPTDALTDLVGLEQRAICLRHILAAPIGMVDEAWRWVPRPNCHPYQRRHNRSSSGDPSSAGSARFHRRSCAVIGGRLW